MIEEADAKRQCVAASSAIVLPSRVGNQARDARCGLRGTRVGEANHPSPHSEVPDDILDDLEFKLGRMDSDSDDEPLLRGREERDAKASHRGCGVECPHLR